MKDKDKEEEEDSLGALDDDERESLINNTEAVCTTLTRVCLFTTTISSPWNSCLLLL